MMPPQEVLHVEEHEELGDALGRRRRNCGGPRSRTVARHVLWHARPREVPLRLRPPGLDAHHHPALTTHMRDDSPPVEIVLSPTEDDVKRDLARLDGSRYGRYARFVLAALSSLPWVGGLIGASAGLYGEHDQEKVNSLQRKWLEEHSERLRDVAAAIDEVTGRLDQFGEEVKERIESEEYLSIVRKAFRAWDAADTKEKRRLVQKLLAHAGGSRITSDDVVRLFVEWIERHHAAHFAVPR